jgi:hypothetical protein
MEKRRGSHRAFMNLTNLLLAALLLFPAVSFSQPPSFLGKVVDESGHPLPGVNVVYGPKQGLVTDAEGRFEFTLGTYIDSIISATFSFIGLKTITLELKVGDNGAIKMEDDPNAYDTYTYSFKASLSAGYYGDTQHAPLGFKITSVLQSIGNTTFETTVNLSYINYDKNSALDVSVNKYIKAPFWAPQNILFSYKELDYSKEEFSIEQFRALGAFMLPRFFAVDVGAVYNRMIENDNFFSGHVGLTKSFYGQLSGLGFHSSATVNQFHQYYDAGIYKGFGIGGVYMVASLKYYNFEKIEGLMAGLKINILSTRYYCCASWHTLHQLANELK